MAYNARMISPLSARQVAALATGAARRVAVETVPETGSTNADLLARAASLDAPVLLAAEAQHAGRGRAGRSWHSAPGASLTFSLAWKFRRGLAQMVGLPLAVGVAVAETLNLLDVPARLKWPNDVLLSGEKLGGILVETAPPGADGVVAVIGVGINLALPPELLARLDRPAAALPSLAAERNALLAALLNALAQACTEFDAGGVAAFAVRWNALHAWRGEEVAVLDGGRTLHQGIAAGIDGSGRLLLDTASGQVAVLSGDVSLRRTAA
jgi:BirA family biotin operon repressor/biotin-[acetyl-CoA-carboxylase] ligase